MSTYALIQDRSELDLIRHWVQIITIIKLFIFLVKTEWEVLQGHQAGQSGGFSFSVIKRGDTNNPVGSNVTPVFVNQIPGLNTLGISAAHIDFAPYGQNLSHTHPRATEILVVLEGALLVGFVTSNPNNTLISKVLNKGDVFVFPIGLIHFQFNIGKTNALAIAALSSQNPGVITIANAVFGSYPPVNREFLPKAFMLDVNVVKDLQKKFWVAN